MVSFEVPLSKKQLHRLTKIQGTSKRKRSALKHGILPTKFTGAVENSTSHMGLIKALGDRGRYKIMSSGMNIKGRGYKAVVKKTFRYSNVFLYNHLYQPSVFRNLFLKSGIKSLIGKYLFYFHIVVDFHRSQKNNHSVHRNAQFRVPS